MIIKTGKITLTGEQLLIEQFHFKDPNIPLATKEAITWAIRELEVRLRKLTGNGHNQSEAPMGDRLEQKSWFPSASV